MARAAASTRTYATAGDKYVVSTAASSVAYVPDDARRLVDVYTPSGLDGPPCVVTLHGGGWRQNDRTEMTAVALRVARHGFACFNARYRLVPVSSGNTDPQWRENLADDARTLVQWVRDHAADYGADGARVGVLGNSAGGHLALLGAATGVRGQTAADAVAAWSPPTKLEDLVAAAEPAANYIGSTDTGNPAFVEYGPYHRASTAMPPVFLGHSTGDATVEVAQSTALGARLTTLGTVVEQHLYAGDNHGVDLAGQALQGSLRFLRAHLGGASRGATSRSTVAVTRTEVS